MARTILAELDKATSGQGLPEDETEAFSDKMELSDTLNAVSQLRRYRALRTAASGSDSDRILAELNTPRTTRRQFLAQRLERRETRKAADDYGETADSDDFTADVRRDVLTDAGLPAQLSEVYRRDARRYDSPFERY